ncbi:MAG: hypothetical protein EZS28_028697, partial [Streblomastix strix]
NITVPHIRTGQHFRPGRPL